MKTGIIPALAILSALTLFLGAVMTVNAGHHNHSMFSTNINDMDLNNDDKVTFEEYSTFHSNQLRWSFDALDTDNDDAITSEEWDMFLKMHGVGTHEHNQPG